MQKADASAITDKDVEVFRTGDMINTVVPAASEWDQLWSDVLDEMKLELAVGQPDR